MLDYSFDELERRFVKEETDAEIEFKALIDQAKYENTQRMVTWEVAELYSKIVNNPLFDLMFGGIREFSEYAGVHRATIECDLRAVEFDEIHHFDHESYSVTKVYELSRAKEDYDKFLLYIANTGMKVEDLKIKQIRDLMDQFYGRSSGNSIEVVYEGEYYSIPVNVFKKFAKKMI